MIVTNALIPTGEQISALAADQRDEPIVMLNLLKFRAKAAYDDGRDPELSGEAAYMRYAAQMIPYVEARGARVLFQGDTRLLAVGAVDDVWDTAALVQYPSARVFLEIAMAPEVHAFAFHREAGLDGQLLLMMGPRP
jgi:uncharacterized protein (DUF1330 family)